MLSIKLRRIGKKNLPSFRVVVGSGKKIAEVLGHYYPHPKSPQFQVERERIRSWLKLGARLTPAVDLLLKGKYEFKHYVAKKTIGSGGGEPTVPKEAEKAAEPDRKENA